MPAAVEFMGYTLGGGLTLEPIFDAPTVGMALVGFESLCFGSTLALD